MQSDKQWFGQALFEAPEAPSRPSMTYRPPPQEKRVLSATNYRPRGWFTHTPVHTCMQTYTETHADAHSIHTHPHTLTIYELNRWDCLFHHYLSSLWCVHIQREGRSMVSMWTHSLCLHLTLRVFNLSFLLVVVVFSPSEWLKRHRTTTSGPQEDVLTPPTNSPSLCYLLLLCQQHAFSLLEVAEGPVARDNSIKLHCFQWEWFWEHKNVFGLNQYLLIHLFIC